MSKCPSLSAFDITNNVTKAPSLSSELRSFDLVKSVGTKNDYGGTRIMILELIKLGLLHDWLPVCIRDL
jgi:hypothetical protein